MNIPLRLLPNWPLPEYIFIPGKNPHPKKAGGHMEGQGDPVAPTIDPDHPEKNEYLRFALDLYNHGYNWESHVFFEALWNAHGRKGSTANLLKGFIKLGAAGVKLSIDQELSAIGHFERAKELFRDVTQCEGPIYLGFNLNQLIFKIEEIIPGNQNTLKIYPVWR